MHSKASVQISSGDWQLPNAEPNSLAIFDVYFNRTKNVKRAASRADMWAPQVIDCQQLIFIIIARSIYLRLPPAYLTTLPFVNIAHFVIFLHT